MPFLSPRADVRGVKTPFGRGNVKSPPAVGDLIRQVVGAAKVARLKARRRQSAQQNKYIDFPLATQVHVGYGHRLHRWYQYAHTNVGMRTPA